MKYPVSFMLVILCVETATAQIFFNPQNGHYYEFMPSQDITWTEARKQAESSILIVGTNRIRGYLATVTSEQEQSFLEEKFNIADSRYHNVWIGASDSKIEGDWRWVTGPEGNINCGQGMLFWQGNGSGSSIAGRYENWHDSPADGEPNNLNGEHFAVWNHHEGEWNDLADNHPSNTVSGFFIEYGGLQCSECCCLLRCR